MTSWWFRREDSRAGLLSDPACEYVLRSEAEAEIRAAVQRKREEIIVALRERWGQEGLCSKLAIEIVEARSEAKPRKVERLANNGIKGLPDSARDTINALVDAVNELRRKP